MKKIVIYLEAKEEDRPFVLKTVKELQASYLSMHNQPPPSSWGAKKLIEILRSKKKHMGRAASKNQSESLEQELTNIILNKMALKPLQGDSKGYHKQGHDLEKIYTKHMMLDSLNNQFPFGKIEHIPEVGLVQKADTIYVKDSVDRLIGYLPKNERHTKLLLCEMKASRVAASTSQEERETVLQHHGQKYVSTHSNSSTSWQYISKPSERLQVLHHCYSYEQTRLLHIAGDTQQILSGVHIELYPDMLRKLCQTAGSSV